MEREYDEDAPIICKWLRWVAGFCDAVADAIEVLAEVANDGT